MFGKIIMIILLMMSLVSSGIYLFGKRENEDLKFLARNIFFGLIIGVILISSIFMLNIVNHNFQYTYIYEYSSTTLNNMLLFASFFAGQQGSLLMWTLFFALIGIFLVPYAKKHNYESEAIGIYAFIMSFLLMMLVFKSPFDFVWETYKNSGFSATNLPIEGKGLNPILENLWIVIHPPILFSGYTALAIPFVFALAGLIKKDFDKWITLATPWVHISSFLLGMGIILGGLWAYETLGWGGFWGWDPVENSSLLPWLAITVLSHTFIVQKRTGGLVRTNLIMAIFSFLLVLFASFLTRSGVLGSMSVHSFTDPGAAVYSLLLGMLIVFALIGGYAFILRKREIKLAKTKFYFSARESFLTYGALIICSILFIILVGTSLPFISEFLSTKSSVDQTFYNNWSIFLVSLILIITPISLYLPWKEKITKKSFKKILINLGISLIITIVSVILGINQKEYYLLLFFSIFSLIANIEFGLSKIRTNFSKIGGNLAHLGLSLLVIGIILMNTFSITKNLNLNYNKTINDLGYNITLVDKIEIEKNKPDRQKFIYRINFENASEKFFADPVVYWSDFNQRKAPIIEPFIKRSLNEDIYVVLKSSQSKGNSKSYSVIRNKETFINNDTNIRISLVSFDMEHSKAVTKDSKIGVIIKVNLEKESYTDTLYTKLVEGSVNSDLKWKSVKDIGIDLTLLKIIPNKEDISKSEAIIMVKNQNQKNEDSLGEELTIEISTKPGINLVWIGFSLIVFGSFFTWIFGKDKLTL